MDSALNTDLKNKVDTDLIAKQLLLRLPSIGPSRYWQLCEMFGSAQQVLYADISSFPKAIPGSTVAVIQQIQNDCENHPLVTEVKKDIAWCAENNIKIISVCDKDYPVLLSKIHSPPPVLYVKGDVTNLSLPQLAIVGSRNPTPTGKENAFYFSKELTHSGFVVTSGLALGVDAAAHHGALDDGGSGKGKTIAVLGTGIDKIYPQRHRQLADDIVNQGGTIISEFALGVGPHASNFPRRNRIISGLSLGVLVVEAAIKSGSLITARLAMQQDREVFAIPGSIHNPLSRGCHSLIKDGATLVEQVSDLNESLQGLLEYKWSELSSKNEETTLSKINDNLFENDDRLTGLVNKSQVNDENGEDESREVYTEEEKDILQAIGFDDTPFDILADRLGYETGALLSTLVAMELKGILLQTTTGYMRATTAKTVV